jgi:N-acetylneuraminic acid mutarotase
MLSHDGYVYLFGGIKVMYGPPKGPGDLSVQGTLNDLWRYDPVRGRWSLLDKHDGRTGYGRSDAGPCTRKLTTWLPVGDRFYLFGGSSVLGPGLTTVKLNDTWSYDPRVERWDLIEPDDGRAMESPTSVGGPRPAGWAAMGSAVLGERPYLMGGIGGPATRRTMMHAQLWSYDVRAGSWEHLGPGSDGRGDWPPKRYCPVLAAWGGRLYLWGGRESEDRAPEFYNDLWEYDPGRGKWTCIAEHRVDDDAHPCPRYGVGHAVVGDHLYVFGGFGGGKGDHPQLNDLWRYDFRAARWDCICPHNEAREYSAGAKRPGVRRIPLMASEGEAVYLFGGLDLATGPHGEGPLAMYNDFWRGTPV